VRAQRDDIGERLVRLRGTKRRSRERDVPIVTDWQGTLVGYALEDARGTAPMLFKKKPDEFRCAVPYAARRAGIDHCTPNDLRRMRVAHVVTDNLFPKPDTADEAARVVDQFLRSDDFEPPMRDRFRYVLSPQPSAR